MGLAGARWITADMAYRRAALADCGGFDERFPRAFREDADLALRLLADGWELRDGRRQTVHPVRAAPAWVSVRAQARQRRRRADAGAARAAAGTAGPGRRRGRRRRHAAITAAAAAAAGLALARRPRAAAAAAARWPPPERPSSPRRASPPGPRTAREIATMAADQPGHSRTGRAGTGCAARWRRRGAAALAAARPGCAVRPGRHADPRRALQRRPGAGRPAAAARRGDRGWHAAQGAAVGMITNQSGIARGLLTAADAARGQRPRRRAARPVRRDRGVPARAC